MRIVTLGDGERERERKIRLLHIVLGVPWTAFSRSISMSVGISTLGLKTPGERSKLSVGESTMFHSKISEPIGWQSNKDSSERRF